MDILTDGTVAVGGEFASAGGQPAFRIARWTSNPRPGIWNQPSPVVASRCPGATVVASSVGPGFADVTYQWYRDGEVVFDGQGGASSGGGFVSGAVGNMPSASTVTPVSLSITNFQPSDEGHYSVTFVNSCGSVTSNVAAVTISQCDCIDFNNDTSFFDPIDIDAFLSSYSEGPCIPVTATCNDIDFNNDGSVFDPCDIDSFLLQFSEGPCTLCGQ